MAEPTDSFKKFDYGLRPSKQVERKILVQLLLKLADAGLPVHKYTYVGFGSVYYVDFVLFHKYLYINKMVCLEWSKVPKRMKFNKPFRFIRLKMTSLSEYIPLLDPNTKYLVWLDYDRPLDAEMLRDVNGCLRNLAPGSIFLVTIEAQARLPKKIIEDEDLDGAPRRRIEDRIVRMYREDFGKLVDDKITRDDLIPAQVPRLFWTAVRNQIAETLRTREGVQYSQLFNYYYADGAPMITIGGIICDGECAGRISDCDILQNAFVTQEQQPIAISVPPLTFREKQWIDSRLRRGLKARHLQFELEDDLLENYIRFYREYPTYFEALA
jgi:hypothetical protein